MFFFYNIVNKAYNIISIVRVDSVKQDPKAYEKLEQELLEEKYIPELCSTVLEVLKTKGRKMNTHREELQEADLTEP